MSSEIDLERIKEMTKAMRLLWKRGHNTHEIANLLNMPEEKVYNYMLKTGILQGKPHVETVVTFTAVSKPPVANE